jgi:hypothetical protein
MTAEGTALSELRRQAQAGAALYWSIYYGGAPYVKAMPARVVEAYGLAQSVFGTHRRRMEFDDEGVPVDPPPVTYVNPGDDTTNGSWSQ